MTSSIDATKPVTGTPTTASVRANFQAAKDEIEALQTANVTAGNGLTGGGEVGPGVELVVGEGTGISVSASAVGLDISSSLNADHSTISMIAGSGLTGGGNLTASATFNVGSGDGITVNADSIEFDTTWGDARYALSSHTHTASEITDHENIDAGSVDGYDVAVVASLPGSPDADTIYFVTA